jgi:hypothetical protein
LFVLLGEKIEMDVPFRVVRRRRRWRCCFAFHSRRPGACAALRCGPSLSPGA